MPRKRTNRGASVGLRRAAEPIAVETFDHPTAAALAPPKRAPKRARGKQPKPPAGAKRAVHTQSLHLYPDDIDQLDELREGTGASRRETARALIDRLRSDSVLADSLRTELEAGDHRRTRDPHQHRREK